MIRFPDRSEVSFELTDEVRDGRCVWRVGRTIYVWIDFPEEAADQPADAAERQHSVHGEIYAAIPAGFLTDGGSIPFWARPWLDPWARIGLEFVLHDYLLSLPGVAKWDADLAFLHALRSRGAPAFLSTLLYLAVRLKRRPNPAQQRSPS